MAEETPATSVRAIAARLNLDQVGRTPLTPPTPRANQSIAVRERRLPPAVPPRPATGSRTQSINNPPLRSNAPASIHTIGNQPISTESPEHSASLLVHSNGDAPTQRPQLPPRPSQRSTEQAPALPPRRPSEPINRRRESVESVSSVTSGQSSVSGTSAKTSFSTGSATSRGQVNPLRVPEYDPATLPVLSKTRGSDVRHQGRGGLKTTSSSAIAQQNGLRNAPVSPPPSSEKKPPVPLRRSSENPETPPQPPPRRSALSFALNQSSETPPPVPAQLSTNETPPPIPLSSRPNLTTPQPSIPTSTTTCLKCRDFSAPDTHASRFPRESIPSTDIHWLAHQLTSPFPSPTDKARVLFTWLHHNIAYNTAAFFSGTVKPSTPASTLASGLAVCEGYAGLFAALAAAAGMQCVVVGGHGKGFGWAVLGKGEAVPLFKGNHAWNAVRIDGGEWKLVDACWGAGAVQGANMPYVKRFAPGFFVMDNVEFGLRHFPEDREHLYRADRRVVSWEEYMLQDAGEERVTVYSECAGENGIGEASFQPKGKRVKVYDPAQPATVRFQFEKVCRHWDSVKQGKGKPYLLVMKVGGRDGRKENFLVLQHDGFFWWVDVPRIELGAPGQTVSVYSITTFDGKDGKGLTREEYMARRGRVGYSFGGIAAWELV